MSDMLQTGAEWLAGKLGTYAAHTVTYIRGSEEVVLSATLGRTELQIDTGVGDLWTEHTDRDFLIQASALILGGETVEPRAGDKIEETVSGTTHTYQVMVPEGLEQPFRYCDANRVMLRIHTKLVSVIPL